MSNVAKKSAVTKKVDKKKAASEEIDRCESGIKSISTDPSQNFIISTPKVAKRYTSNQSMRQWKYDKHWSVRRKELMKARKYFKNHDDILETHIPYGPIANKSPHIMVNHLYWGLWAVNQAAEEGCDEFDYLTYAANRLNEYYVKKAEWKKKS